MAFGKFSPERARWSSLARSGSQSQCAIWFILLAHGASHKIKPITTVRGVPVLSENSSTVFSENFFVFLRVYFFFV